MTLAKPATSLRPALSEWTWVLALLGGFFAFNLATYNLYPAVWCDEPYFSEPAVNLVKYGSFTTRVWQFSPLNTFPTVNCPLYLLAQVPWLALLGTSLLAVRAFNYALMAIAAFLVWRASWRFGLVRSSWARLLMIPALHLGYGMSYSYRCSRPDILGMVCVLLLLLAFGLTRPRLRDLCLVLLSATTVWIGLQVALYAWVASFAAWLLLSSASRPEHGPQPLRLREMVLLSLGMALGAGTLVAFLAWKGALAWFLPPVVGLLGKNYAHAPQLPVVARLAHLVHEIIACYLEELTSVILLLGLLILVAPAWKQLTAPTRKLVLFSVALFFGLPAFFDLIGHFAFYYSYMRFVPLLLAFLAVGSELGANTGEVRRWARPVFAATLAAGMLVGLPLRLGIVAACYRLVPRAELQRTVASNVSRNDVVFSDMGAFFEAKQAAEVVYDFCSSSALLATSIPGRDFTPGEKQSVSVVITSPAQKDHFCGFFGGEWVAVTPPFGDSFDFTALARLPIIGRKFASYSGQPQNDRHPMQIFRRSTN
ncbi:MAG TPA: hypothetical protein VN578_01340 [Candidatus Binatia bacterium]|jgi:hypothetical protein|nr:hypothetical protein [Candidatus Binatia bacterium]